jgi:hypothetical protein
MSAIYLIDLAGALTGPITLPVVPGIGCQMPEDAVDLGRKLEAPVEGYVWALVEGKPVQVADQRGQVYSTATGTARPYTALGDLPSGLTEQPWPGPFHVWGGSAWVLDETAQREAAQEVERVWRNVQISATDYLAMPDYPITTAQRSELYTYRQALRDWPDVTLFPDKAGRPQPPVWFAQLSE